MKRYQARRGNGRYTRSTMANTFGLHVYVCADCRGLVPVNVGEPTPPTCHHCGKPLRDAAAKGAP